MPESAGKTNNNQCSIGLLAPVDAGKTTLAEAMLYQTGKIRKLGRVDHGSTLMDAHELERERGITIFASQAVLNYGGREFCLLDTPGHVDFSAETERTLQVLDYAVLVVSGTDGVRAHTRTLWRLLELYNVPTFIFVTKMDFARREREDLMRELQEELSPQCIDFSKDASGRFEALALCREDLLDRFLETGRVSDKATEELIRARKAFPCCFGSGLKLEGIDEFLEVLGKYAFAPEYGEAFGAKVFKITYDNQGSRITHMKITGGSLKVRDSVKYGDQEEKISQIRIYSGARFTAADEAPAGTVCAVTGLSATKSGQGIGAEEAAEKPYLEPVMNYRVVLPPDCDAETALVKLRRLEEEDPQLNITWNSHLKEIHVGLMGEVQAEILRSVALERFGMNIKIDSGRVMYKETIEDVVEGVGHYEPLRHYAEVHLILEPLPRGSGLVFSSRCSEDLLDRNWQRLILTHLAEKQHLGVLTGSPITDMKITLAAGRAHMKHTEGGDFRQATYRAVRQGLMRAQGVLLEPYYAFRLEVPPEQLGRAINDIRMRSGSFDTPEDSGGMSVLKGRAPVTEMNGYASELASYTAGHGRLRCDVDGYDICHNPQEVIAELAYEPESDLENTPDSVFCAHGGGFTVKWSEVPEYMHLESCLKQKTEEFEPKVVQRNLNIDDKELEKIMEREFGPIKRPLYSPPSAVSSELPE
ncbi:MAG: TetM/TetW/TetO/TetS family tetracycline resistance ribosomal protection protein, partial [Oscillospiraceae bacterium]|nr:TetM/TetW/TetO/TetS family tetracycline resistance ribosomal protection protein [Oscillospiraceae bacterium]